MPSDQRLHPASFLFAIAGHLRNFLLPGLVVIFTAGAASGQWEFGFMTLVLPIAGFALVRCLSYRYRLEESELVVRTGFVFRNERHIPYARIQNVEAIRNVFHRLLRVVEVRIETGASNEDEAVMRVVPDPAYEEIRVRVQAHRAAPAAVADAESPVPPEGSIVLELPPRELLLSGLIANRSAVVIGAALGVVWELGMFDFLFNSIFGENVSARGLAREMLRALIGRGMPSLWYLLLAAGTVFALLSVVTLISMGWALVRLYGFTLRRVGDDLLAEYGLFTRISTTIPMRRVQTLTVFEGPLFRLFDRASVKVETAGGDAGEAQAARKEPLVPIVRADQLQRFLKQVLPEVEIDAAEWEPSAPRAVRRVFRQGAIVATIFSAFFVLMLELWTLALLSALLAISYVHARRYVASLGWSVVDNAVLFRRGWVWKRLTAARFSKMQTIALHESPFDRRNRMARVQVDTAGARTDADAVNIPYIPADVASQLHRRLALEASRTSFEW